MEITLSLAIGMLTASGVWLILRPRTYQVIIGLSLISYAVNLFLFSSGRLILNRAPVLLEDVPQTLEYYTDPIPQALVLTAIVIGFATTALFLVVLMAARGFNGNDHVDGTDTLQEPEQRDKTQERSQ
ncbi:Na(+)/H(+) antiporter subunit C1 [Saezia sanguinis]|jgi:multicomponent K+:H+ antiporter subunit C|uniref:Na(+)/H(+) antiporter subunit C1 n=1 Tax=Saezia sanguinis TaxID=1965230 RepID=A0A433SBV1_9BURK|nr:Na+/H+ antiporter subunit C [Saezia sanguinis]RUS66176.1 Na(+)/H(+) antiporter subunit C1 [Saezia sanguinis]